MHDADNENQRNVTRQLRAILSADAKGYSILMSNDEESTIRTLKDFRQIMSDAIESHSGRVVDMPGDNVLAEFSSILNAVKSAVSLQKILKEKNDKLPDYRKLEFRIGINIGDVVQDGNNLYGEGVNIAARIEKLASPGGICISRGAYDHIRNKLNLDYRYIGEHRVKNIKNPVRVYKIIHSDNKKEILTKKFNFSFKKSIKMVAKLFSLLTFFLSFSIGILYWKYIYLPPPVAIEDKSSKALDLPQGPSLTVLPFINISQDPEQEYLCYGLTETITSRLTHIKELFVVIHNMTGTQPVRSDLNVQYILEGSVQEFDNRLRITVQLIDTKKKHHIWSDTYDSELKNIFKIQDKIAIEICEAIQIKLTEGESFRNRFKGIEDAQTAIQILKLTNRLRRGHTKEDIAIGLQEIGELIERNPTIQIAYALHCMYNLLALQYGVCENSLICFAKATSATRRALKIDDTNSDVHIASSLLFLIKGKHDDAVQAAKRAIFLNPNNGDAYIMLAYALVNDGRPREAIAYIKKGLAIAPVPPVAYSFHAGAAYLDAGEYGKALKIFKDIVALHPDHLASHRRLIVTYSRMGDPDNAKKSALALLRKDPTFRIGNISQGSLPYRRKLDLDRYLNALRLAGIPD